MASPCRDSRLEDFEVLEDGVAQQIKTFEHIVITPAGPPETRREPSSQRDMIQQATNPRSRVFVIFLDTWNVSVTGSHNIAEPVIRLLDRIIGPDDLVGIMTPAMAASQVILARKTQVIEEGLRTNWAWGMRHSLMNDNREYAYKACYPPVEADEKGADSKLATKMIARKRERATFEALQDLVFYLQAIREERKAIITVTEGWVRFRPDHEMMRLRENRATGYQEPIPGPERIGVDRNGKLTTTENKETDSDSLSKRECDTDRMRLAMMDNEQFFRDIVDDANRGNASFYPVDPRGLPVFDYPIGPDAPPPVNIDNAILRDRLESLHDLALATDGLAVVNSNDLDKGLRRISDDLTSYYLLGYYSTNTKLDGKFRRLQVRVKQPGVQIRARRGYRAATAEEVASARAGTEKPSPEKAAFSAAMGMLSRIRPESRFRINAAVQKQADGGTVWVAGELPETSTRTDEFALGATADIEVKAGERVDHRPRHDEAGRTRFRRAGEAACRKRGARPGARQAVQRGESRPSDRCDRGEHGVRAAARVPARRLHGKPVHPGRRLPLQPDRTPSTRAASWRRRETGRRKDPGSRRPDASNSIDHRRAHGRGDGSEVDDGGPHTCAARGWRLCDRVDSSNG